MVLNNPAFSRPEFSDKAGLHATRATQQKPPSQSGWGQSTPPGWQPNARVGSDQSPFAQAQYDSTTQFPQGAYSGDNGGRSAGYTTAGYDGEVMTVNNTLVKTVLCFAILLVGAAFGWLAVATGHAYVPIAGAIAALVLGIVIAFRRQPSAVLVLIVAACEGLFVGGMTLLMQSFTRGNIVTPAVLGTVVVVGATLALYANGKIRATPKMTRFFMVAFIGYALFGVINMILMLTGAVTDPFGVHGITVFGIPLGLGLGLLAIGLAAYSLVLDFDFIERAVANKAPAAFGWIGAYGVMVTVVWIYIELLRLFAILGGRR